MSRVGKNPILIPSGVSVTRNGDDFTFTGKKGTQTFKIPSGCFVEESPQSLLVKPANKNMHAMWGTVARTIHAAIQGVNEGFSLNLDLVGVGYRASVSGDKIQLQLGFSHDIIFQLPSGVQAKTDKPTTIVLSGVSRQQVGQVAAQIRSYRPPEPYKGKGIIREKEFVLRKEGKKK